MSVHNMVSIPIVEWEQTLVSSPKMASDSIPTSPATPVINPYEETEVSASQLLATANKIENFFKNSTEGKNLQKSISKEAKNLKEKADENEPAVIFGRKPRKSKAQIRKRKDSLESEKENVTKQKQSPKSKKARISFQDEESESIISKRRTNPSTIKYRGKEEKLAEEKKKESQIPAEIEKLRKLANFPSRERVFGPSFSDRDIGPRQRVPQRSKELNREEILNTRFSQVRISEKLSDGTYVFSTSKPKVDAGLRKLYERNRVASSESELSLEDILRKNGWDKTKSALKTVEMPDGILTSFDNRRLAAASTIVKVFSNSLTLNADVFPHEYQTRDGVWKQVNSTPNETPQPEGIVYDTYGHALMSRITNKGQLPPIYGYTELPKIGVQTLRGLQHKKITCLTDQIIFS